MLLVGLAMAVYGGKVTLYWAVAMIQYVITVYSCPALVHDMNNRMTYQWRGVLAHGAGCRRVQFLWENSTVRVNWAHWPFSDQMSVVGCRLTLVPLFAFVVGCIVRSVRAYHLDLSTWQITSSLFIYLFIPANFVRRISKKWNQQSFSNFHSIYVINRNTSNNLILCDHSTMTSARRHFVFSRFHSYLHNHSS